MNPVPILRQCSAGVTIAGTHDAAPCRSAFASMSGFRILLVVVLRWHSQHNKQRTGGGHASSVELSRREAQGLQVGERQIGKLNTQVEP